MEWAMSEDYASLLTTLIVAIFAVGTIQTYTFFRKWGDLETEELRKSVDARVRVLEALRLDEQPTADDLKAAHVTALKSLKFSRRTWAPYVVAFTWVLLVVLLGAQQIKILRWAASASKPQAPHLAESSFYLVSIALVLVLTEGGLRAVVRALSDQRSSLSRLDEYPRSERDRMRQAAREYQRTGQMPTPPSPPENP
jgi:hypothetical protein